MELVSGTALAAGVFIRKDWKTPAASAVTLTEESMTLKGSFDRRRFKCQNRNLVSRRLNVMAGPAKSAKCPRILAMNDLLADGRFQFFVASATFGTLLHFI